MQVKITDVQYVYDLQEMCYTKLNCHRPSSSLFYEWIKLTYSRIHHRVTRVQLSAVWLEILVQPAVADEMSLLVLCHSDLNRCDQRKVQHVSKIRYDILLSRTCCWKSVKVSKCESIKTNMRQLRFVVRKRIWQSYINDVTQCWVIFDIPT